MSSRPFDIPIPDEPRDPFPIVTDYYCDIVCGFGRGSKDLGVPTANVEMSQLPASMNSLDLGVYFGFAQLRPVDKTTSRVNRKDGKEVEYNYGEHLSEKRGELDVLPMVLSVGKNPFYGNDFKTAELHILHNFSHNFYGAQVKFNILGHIRPELNYTTKEALIKDINTDIDIAKRTLESVNYIKFKDQF
ncbi:riboflavin kinase NDAI_0C05050 [Naumovozyma dairenensis CBS 421]|uniref:Riboflavin kinase n=1 Tax=Naumovozyma dairenensis (strain ATCC 10597 / BCRC 20456 / CBS 421 / NBRC 0211 / NRRL Y-12639) TaxID=1071378 RepID=G0W8Q3_NAUDC|nr:hypothetical protein NDAI_0C05050 [Naumovozyma dairenensis CBS 421]CCD24164.1 hypothetical protein NDAI_0C05050 [Naumovozyma dairenensis CBS 421]